MPKTAKANATVARKKIGLVSCLLFGVGVLSPLSPFLVYGDIQPLTRGHMSLSYVIALVPMIFIAYVYGIFSAQFPRGGSAYTYVSKGLNSYMGFMSGWMILLDYCLVPLMSYMFMSIFLTAMFPFLNRIVIMLILIVLVSVINLLGIKGLARINNLATVFAFAVVLYFIVASIAVFVKGTDGIAFTTAGFFNKENFSGSLIAQGAAMACFSFLGFDALTTLAEDVDKPVKTMPKAIVFTCIIMAFIFISVSWIAQCLYPDFNAYSDPSAGIMDALAIVGGSTLCNLVSITIVICLFAITVDMMAASTRMMYAMGRDNALPRRLFGYENVKTHVPVWNIIILSAVSACFIWVDVSIIVSMVTFGGLLAYILVNLAAIRFFFFEKKERKGSYFITRLIFPGIGLLTSIVLWISLGVDAKILGFSWTAFGIVYLIVRSRCFKKPITLNEEEQVDALQES